MNHPAVRIALILAAVHLLTMRVAILPGVTVPVAVLVLLLIAAAIAAVIVALARGEARPHPVARRAGAP
jgi:hypothetical protein